jgi:hypothetical protein
VGDLVDGGPLGRGQQVRRQVLGWLEQRLPSQRLLFPLLKLALPNGEQCIERGVAACQLGITGEFSKPAALGCSDCCAVHGLVQCRQHGRRMLGIVARQQMTS